MFDVDRPAWQQKLLLVLLDVVCNFGFGIPLLLDSRDIFQPLSNFRSLCGGVVLFILKRPFVHCAATLCWVK